MLIRYPPSPPFPSSAVFCTGFVMLSVFWIPMRKDQNNFNEMYAKFVLCTVFIVLFGVTSECLQRKVLSAMNPQCPPSYPCSSKEAQLFYSRANGDSDSLHYFWSFYGKPTMMVALTSLNSNATFTWPQFPNQSFVSNGTITFTEQPMYVFGVVINWMFEFNDGEDIGKFNVTNTNSSYVRELPLPSNWTMSSVIFTDDSVKLKMIGTWNNTLQGVTSGLMELNLEAYGSPSHGDDLPRMKHTANSSQIEMILRDVETSSGFASRRFGLQLVVTGSEHVKGNWSEHSFKGLDDENTPGIFTLTEIQSPTSMNESAGGYLQWRPVSYIADVRDITNSTEMFLYPVQNLSSSDVAGAFNKSLVPAFSDLDVKSYLTQSCIVSFGAVGDGFYSKYNYTSWTVTIGYGSPPRERFSLLVILVIGACLGVPGLLILGSGVYLCIRSIAKRKDDLLLTS